MTDTPLKPWAWMVKDFADGWIWFRTEAEPPYSSVVARGEHQ